jgi:hypothetical protein
MGLCKSVAMSMHAQHTSTEQDVCSWGPENENLCPFTLKLYCKTQTLPGLPEDMF